MSNEAFRLLKTEEAAALLGLAPNTLVNMRANREGPPYVKLGSSGRVRYRMNDLLKYIDQNVVRPGAA